MTLARVAPWISLLLAALALRGAALGVLGAELRRDPDSYRLTAQTLAAEGVFAPDELASQASGRPIPGAYRPPLYPLLLAGMGAVSPETSWRTGLAQLALGVATVGLAFALARRWRLGRWSWLAAGLVAADPLLLSLSAQIMTETLAAFLVVATLLAVDHAIATARQDQLSRAVRATIAWSMTAGALGGLAVLCRPTFLPWALGLPLIVGLASSLRPNEGGVRGQRFAPALACLAAFSLVLAPWAIRNARALGNPLLTTTHGGYTFYLVNNRELFAHQRGDSAVAWNAADFNARWRAARAAALGPGPGPQGTELAADRLAYQRARQEIAADPAGFARATWLRLARLWGALPERLAVDESPRRRAERWAIAAWYGVVLPLAALGLWVSPRCAAGSPDDSRAGWVRLAPLLWLLASVTALHALYWTNLRMRAPLMPGVALLAAAGASQLARWKWRWRSGLRGN